MRSIILAAIFGVLASTTAGCGGECEALDAASTPPRMLGTYECEQTASLQDCAGIVMCQGETTITVMRDAAGKWVIGKTDCNGNYYELEGAQVCAPPDGAGERYTVNAYNTESEQNATLQQSSSINLTIDLSGSGAPKLSGTLNKTITPQGGKACTLMGNISGACIDCAQ